MAESRKARETEIKKKERYRLLKKDLEIYSNVNFPYVFIVTVKLKLVHSKT